MRWTLPNILTLFRLIAAPMVGLIFLLLPRPRRGLTPHAASRRGRCRSGVIGSLPFPTLRKEFSP